MRLFYRVSLIATLFVVCSGFMLAVLPLKVLALSGTDFNPGNIINNQNFTNSSSMSVTDIQNFLNSQVSCDTQGTTPMTYYINQSTGEVHSYSFGGSTQVSGNFASYGQAYANYWNVHTTDSQGDARSSIYISNQSVAPYVCLNSYIENPSTLKNNLQNPNANVSGGESAAQIIYNAAQTYQINPQVLLVTLQKEQGLVTDNWPWMDEYEVAMGYGCPDTAPCNSQYYGFANQVKNAAAQFRNYLTNPNGFNYVVGADTILYNPNANCGSSVVNIVNQATAALYDYTPYQPNAAALAGVSSSSNGGTGNSCSSYGNRNFWWYYNVWFGSSTSTIPTQCNSKVLNIVCVWSLRKSDGSQLLTSSQSELFSAMYQYGWTNEGIAFYTSATQNSGTVPVYRLQQTGTDVYYFTANQTEYMNMLNAGGWTDEGVGFYAMPASGQNSTYQVYKLYNSATGKYDWAIGGEEETFLLQSGYQLQSNSFNTFSGLISPPTPANGRYNIYQVKTPKGYLYTTSLGEVDNTVSSGWIYQGVLTSSDATDSSTPVYRLRYDNRYFYTSNPSERDIAESQYGYVYEGIGFYVDSTSGTLYRIANNLDGAYALVNSDIYVLSLVNTGGWTYQEPLVSSTASPSPVYRFVSIYNGSHFYTIDLNEAAQVANKNGWQFETIAFSGDKTSGSGLLPVYRLRMGNTYLYTTNSNEESIAINKYGYSYEEIAYYVSSTTTANPAYRLQKGNDYLYTASSTEMNSAMSKYGYQYEGIAFYLPTT